jgi:hypothetical protein
MWIKLGVERPGVVSQVPSKLTWINTDHIVRVEFEQSGNETVATVTSTKPGGSDRTIFKGDDAERLRLTLEHIKQSDWEPLLGYEIEANHLSQEAVQKSVKGKKK